MSERSISGARKFAEALARELFTNGSGDVAQRLVLSIDKPSHRDLGGWCEAVIIDKIEAALVRSSVPVRASGEPQK